MALTEKTCAYCSNEADVKSSVFSVVISSRRLADVMSGDPRLIELFIKLFVDADGE